MLGESATTRMIGWVVRLRLMTIDRLNVFLIFVVKMKGKYYGHVQVCIGLIGSRDDSEAAVSGCAWCSWNRKYTHSHSRTYMYKCMYELVHIRHIRTRTRHVCGQRVACLYARALRLCGHGGSREASKTELCESSFSFFGSLSQNSHWKLWMCFEWLLCRVRSKSKVLVMWLCLCQQKTF